MNWRDKGKCREAPPHVIDKFFFPSDSVLETPPEAAEYCEFCPVKQQCFEAGESEEYGVWGGVLKRPVNDSEPTENGKLKTSQIVEIKQMLAEGFAGKDIAAAYGVHKSLISKIKNGLRWANIA